MNALPDTKQEARAVARRERAHRASLPQHASAATAMARVWQRWLRAHPLMRHVAGYAAIRDELDCTPALEVTRQMGGTTYYPRVRHDAGLDMVSVRDEHRDLHPARWGLREPCGSHVALATLDVILVPGLCFDRHGGRLGYGMGHYDRVLAQSSCTSPRALWLGVCDAAMIVDGRMSLEAHDQRMDGLLTPQGIISFV